MQLTLREWRESRNLSQFQMASKIGVHRNTYFLWEHEPHKIPVGQAIKIANVLKVSIQDITWRKEVRNERKTTVC